MPRCKATRRALTREDPGTVMLGSLLAMTGTWAAGRAASAVHLLQARAAERMQAASKRDRFRENREAYGT